MSTILISDLFVVREKKLFLHHYEIVAMNCKDTYGIYNNTAEHISLLKYSKSSCGVDFLLNTAESTEKRGWFDADKRYRTDFFEFYFFRKAEGYLFLAGERIELHPGMWLVISPFQLQEWHVEMDRLDYTFLVFQEEFVNNFLSDKYFMYRLLYCYQHDYPTWFDMPEEEARPLLRQLSPDCRLPLPVPSVAQPHLRPSLPLAVCLAA